jgi:hypothetical protein
MLDTPQERNALLASLWQHHSGLVARQSRGDEDDMQDLLLKLLESSPDFLLPEFTAYEIGQVDAQIEAVREELARPSKRSRRKADELYAKLGRLHVERDHLTAGPWIRTVLYRKALDRYEKEANRARIIRKRAPELVWRYKSGTGPSAEWVVLRKLEEEDIRRRIARLPPKLAQVAALLYDGYTYREIAGILGVKEPAVRKRVQSIRSPKFRAVLGMA